MNKIKGYSIFILSIISICAAAQLIESENEKVQENNLIKRYEGHSNRKLVVFMDGTGNNEHTNTNILQMYKLSLIKAENTAIIPLYLNGVGSSWFNKISGGSIGKGLDKKIRQAYKFLVQNYNKGDEIFIFGFSRGAYSARSLSGLIEFGNLLDRNKISKNELDNEIKSLYKIYNTYNDGKAYFELRLRDSIGKKFKNKILESKIQVTAIGVFDTVPALGLKNDDFPDNHRTDLYALNGYHALSLDEQRYSFRLLRFNNIRLTNIQTLKEVWFTGAHADVGGGFEDINGLSSVSRNWMLDAFCQFDIFPNNSNPSNCTKATIPSYCSMLEKCEYGELHDLFLSSKLYRRMGISRRMPKNDDFIHGSVVCRINKSTPLNKPNSGREPNGKYLPFNLKIPIFDNYQIVPYLCS